MDAFDRRPMVHHRLVHVGLLDAGSGTASPRCTISSSVYRRRHPTGKTVMSPNSDSGPTELLRAWSQGDGSALDRLIPLVYDELHRLARHYMRQERPDHTLQATSLVNEAYLRLIDVNRVEWRNRAHFLAGGADDATDPGGVRPQPASPETWWGCGSYESR